MKICVDVPKNPYHVRCWPKITCNQWQKFHAALNGSGLNGEAFLGSWARTVWDNCCGAWGENIKDAFNKYKLLSGDSSNAPGVLPDGKGITGHKGESQLTGQSRGGEVVDLYIHAVLRAYALGYAGRARLAERMNDDSVLKVPRGGLIE